LLVLVVGLRVCTVPSEVHGPPQRRFPREDLWNFKHSAQLLSGGVVHVTANAYRRWAGHRSPKLNFRPPARLGNGLFKFKICGKHVIIGTKSAWRWAHACSSHPLLCPRAVSSEAAQLLPQAHSPCRRCSTKCASKQTKTDLSRWAIDASHASSQSTAKNIWELAGVSKAVCPCKNTKHDTRRWAHATLTQASQRRKVRNHEHDPTIGSLPSKRFVHCRNKPPVGFVCRFACERRPHGNQRNTSAF